MKFYFYKESSDLFFKVETKGKVKCKKFPLSLRFIAPACIFKFIDKDSGINKVFYTFNYISWGEPQRIWRY